MRVASGEAVVRLIEQNIRPRDICTRKAFENAAVVVAATGGSTNGGLHLPAMAHECGIEFTLRDVAEIFRRTPYLADLKPGGRYVAKDMGEAGGVPMLLKTLLEAGLIHGDCMTVTGKTIAENLADVIWRDDQDVIRPVVQSALADRRRGRPLGLARAGRRHRQGGRHDLAPRPPRPGAGVRRRGGLLRGGRGAATTRTARCW